MALYTAPVRGMSVFAPVHNQERNDEALEAAKIVNIHPDGIHVDVVFLDGTRAFKINIDKLEPSGANLG